MTKYHINAKGIPAPCRATKGNCPFGGEDGQQNHFDTLDEAQAAANREHLEEHSLLPKIDNHSNESRKEKEMEPSGQLNDTLSDLDSETVDEKEHHSERLEEAQEDSQEKRWYVYADGTHSRQEREGEVPLSVLNDWDSAVKEISKVNEHRFNEMKGIDTSVSSKTIEEQESYYLAQDDVAEGVKQGPHRSFNNRAEIRDFVLSYLGHDTANSLNYEKAEKITFTSKRDTVILGQGEKARGLAGFLGRRTHKRGIVLKSSVVRGEDDEGKRDSQLPRMLEVEYLDEEGVKQRVRKHAEAARGGVGTYANPHVYFPKNLMK